MFNHNYQRNMQSEEIEQLSKWWRGYHIDHEHSSCRNITNIVICILFPLPSIVLAIYILGIDYAKESGSVSPVDVDNPSFLSQIWNDSNASFGLFLFWSPMTLVNLMFFVNVDVGLYLIGLAQKSFWLIDPYWTILPPMYGVIWACHPLATQNFRGTISLILVFIWGIRLTHSYFRREHWKFGVREDWRYTEMAIKHGRIKWYILSFFVVGVAQHPMIVGISLPLYSVRFGINSEKAFGVLDVIAVILCLAGIGIAMVSDNQLRAYVVENQRRRKEGEAVIPVLDTGLWKYSRHPNYFGEQLWWWSLALFSI